MSRGKGLVSIALLLVTLAACAPAPRTTEDQNVNFPDDRVSRSTTTIGDSLRCTDRATIPQIEHVTNAKWSADSSALAVSRIVNRPSSTTISGYEETLRVTVLNMATGTVRELGQGNRPEWSGTGTYLSYWRRDGYLYVDQGGATVAKIEASDPEVRWKGDGLYFWYDDEIRVWHDGTVDTVARVDPELIPRYPRDDAYFSADAARFTLTRYSFDGSAERYVGDTSTGQMTPLDEPGITYTEWAPKGQTLLVRSNDRIVLREPDGTDRANPLAGFSGPVHGWTADGRLLVGVVSATVPGGNVFDRIPVWDPDDEGDKAIATLPNLLGMRSFSPDGRWFGGVSRTGNYGTQLELYRCGVTGSQGVDLRADPAARSRLARIASDSRRFVRPVTGAISQFLQGNHTGIDIAAPFGSLIVAADDGVVDAVGWVQVGGRRVCVQHQSEIESCYYHTSAALVSIGDHVARGQPIAPIGMTGATTGPHVHWEVKHEGRIIDPLGL